MPEPVLGEVHEAVQLPPSGAGVKNAQSFHSAVLFHSVVLRHNFTI
jgi:hypothetical protein